MFWQRMHLGSSRPFPPVPVTGAELRPRLWRSLGLLRVSSVFCEGLRLQRFLCQAFLFISPPVLAVLWLSIQSSVLSSLFLFLSFSFSFFFVVFVLFYFYYYFFTVLWIFCYSSFIVFPVFLIRFLWGFFQLFRPFTILFFFFEFVFLLFNLFVFFIFFFLLSHRFTVIIAIFIAFILFSSPTPPTLSSSSSLESSFFTFLFLFYYFYQLPDNGRLREWTKSLIFWKRERKREWIIQDMATHSL